MDDTELTTIHGDTWYSPVWAVINKDGTTKDLTGWSIRAQLRRITKSSTVVYTWDLDHGASVLSALVQLNSTGAQLTTDAVQLSLVPGDYEDLPLSFTGVLDVEISSDSSDAPDERYTIVPARTFRIIADVSRD